MTATYDPDLIDRLVREARPGDFDVNELTSWALDCCDDFPVTAPAAERVLRRLYTMADQLEAARREVAAWRRKAEVTLKLFGETQTEVRQMQPVVDDAERWRDACTPADFHVTRGGEHAAALSGSVDAYRAAKGKT